MKNIFTTLFVKAVNANIKTETESACAFWGYQPKMPETVKKFRKKSKK
ncbi:MAG: cyclic lactone autoinducer peptide [Lachnospiraceae bacterium]|nr:cyclic lactone autoinducer peptide [Lachnospiraceae bacterium]